MMSLSRARWLLQLWTMLGVGCTWTRFDDVMSNSPVQILNSPSDTHAVGISVAAMKNGSSTIAFATTSDGYVKYEFDARDLRSNDAVTQGTCSADNECWLSTSVAPILQTIEGAAQACFAYGVDTNGSEEARLLLSCEKNLVQRLPVPPPLSGDLAALTPNAKPPVIHFASAPRLAPDLLVGVSRGSGAVWMSPIAPAPPVLVPKPAQAGISFGSAIALAGSAERRFIVVGDPTDARVHVLPTDGTSAPSTSLCLKGTAHFSAALAPGHFTTAESLDLAIASDSELVVVPALETLPFSSELAPPCVELSAIDSVRRISCESLNGGNDCAGLLDAVALAASDLDGDGTDELLVGTPSVSSRGNDAAGKILVVTFAEDRPRLIEELTPSSVESGDRLGTSLTGVPLSRPDVILAGAPGGNKLAAFFCTSLLGAGKGGARCD